MIKKVDDLLLEIKDHVLQISSVNPVGDSSFYIEFRAQYNSHLASYRQSSSKMVELCNELIETLELKKSNVTKPILVEAADVIKAANINFLNAINDLNSDILSHNASYDNFEKKVRIAKDNVIRHYCAVFYPSYLTIANNIKSIESKLQPVKDEISKLRAEENILDSQLKAHDIAVERINELLASFIGRTSIRLVTQEKGYLIEREGIRANNLSEGERTAIAFTYFIAKMEEKDFVISDSIIVIDDPISSLDTNALYASGSFIRCHLERASQIFILTHNYQFFREMFGWIDKIIGGNEGYPNTPYKSYLMLKCETNKDGKRVTIPQKLDKTLKNYDSEYLFLLKQLFEARGSLKSQDSLEPDEIAKLMFLPNIARKVLETFILFKFPDIQSGSIINLYKSISNIELDIPKERISILDRVLNRASHGGEDGMASMNIFNLSETPKVIEYVLDFIEKADADHFNGAKRAIGIKESGKSNIVIAPNYNKTGNEEAA